MDYRIVVALIFAGFGLAELVTRRLLHADNTRAKDLIIELGSGIVLPVVVIPGVLTLSSQLTEWLAPGSRNALAGWGFWSMFAVLLVADDLLQYLWHRASHAWPWLYRLHRAHHSGEYMSVRVVFRNNLLYYAFMPSLWVSGALLHMGFAKAYYAYYIAKMAVVVGAHSSAPWDAPLMRVPLLRPVMWVLVRVFSTPTTHAAHHGKYADDPATHYKGNYGNFLFLWDVLFGTAKITDERPREYGLENVEPETWFRELLWPFGRRGPASSSDA